MLGWSNSGSKRIVRNQPARGRTYAMLLSTPAEATALKCGGNAAAIPPLAAMGWSEKSGAPVKIFSARFHQIVQEVF